MGLFGSSSVQLPTPPDFYQNPYVFPAIQQGLGFGNDFINQGSSLSPSLQEATSTNPQSSALAIQALQAQLAPSLRNSQQDIINQLEANNQLTGSTTASSLGNLQSDYLSQITSAGLQASLNDINRAMGARIQLAGYGGNLIGTAGNQALTDQSQHNEFNLNNYQNQVAQTLAGQKQQNGGIIGAITGGLGGFLAGGPVGAGIGALAGGLGPQGTGGSFLQAGAGVYGGNQARLASPNPYTLQSSNGEQINDFLGAKSPFSSSTFAPISNGLF